MWFHTRLTPSYFVPWHPKQDCTFLCRVLHSLDCWIVNKISHSCQVGINIGYGGMTKVLALLLARLSPVPTNPTIVVAHRQLWLLQKYWLHLFEIFTNSLSIRRNLKSLVSHQYVLCLLQRSFATLSPETAHCKSGFTRASSEVIFVFWYLATYACLYAC